MARTACWWWMASTKCVTLLRVWVLLCSTFFHQHHNADLTWSKLWNIQALVCLYFWIFHLLKLGLPNLWSLNELNPHLHYCFEASCSCIDNTQWNQWNHQPLSCLCHTFLWNSRMQTVRHNLLTVQMLLCYVHDVDPHPDLGHCGYMPVCLRCVYP